MGTTGKQRTTPLATRPASLLPEHDLTGALDTMRLPVLALDEAGRVLYANRAVAELLARPRQSLLGQSWALLRSGRLEGSSGGEFAPCDVPCTFEEHVCTGMGDERIVSWNTSRVVIAGHNMSYILYVGQDITEHRRSEQMLRHQTLHDELTTLPNRALFHDRLRQAIVGTFRTHHQFTVGVMDINGFRDINETFDPTYGDEVLRQVAARLQAALRASDTVARVGGDSFAFLLPTASDGECALQVVEKMQRALEDPFIVREQPFQIRASFGLVLCPEHGDEVDVVLRRADTAMYLSKRTRDAVTMYSPREDDQHPGRLALLGELRHAIDNGELVMHYQPSMDFHTGKVDRVEALVRWVHPLRGLMRPDEFIPLAEDGGLIGALSEWVLTAVLRQQQEWAKTGLNTGVAVNLSMRNLHDPQLPEVIRRLLSFYHADPSSLTIEITESTIMADPRRAMQVLAQLRAMGIQISIDDFGTGYSSLAYLKQLPVDEIKIDKSFVLDMATSDNDAFIVRSTMNLGHDLGLKVVAEGVETQGIWDLLHSLGCDAAQGFLLSRPVPADEIACWLRKTLDNIENTA